MAEPPPLDRALDFGGRVVVVTGARAGIGAGIAARFAQAGATVVRHVGREPEGAGTGPVGRRPEGPGTGPVGRRPEGPGRVAGDLRDPAAVAALVEEVVDRHGRLDVVVANAADQRLADLARTDAASWAEVLATNVTAVAELLRRAAPHLAATGGSAVAIGSIEAVQPAPAHGAYGTSKAALVALVRAAAAEYGPTGVRVNVVHPGLVDRPGLAADWPEGVERWRQSAPLGRLGTPADVADACLFLCSPLARWITGAALTVDGGVLTRPTW